MAILLVLTVPAAAELELKPCTIELIDGSEVQGMLAVQFDMNDHLIVYSPRLATVRSFLKKHVHALTVDDQRKTLNPKKALTEQDREVLGRIEWPNEPSADGVKPPYTTETWSKPKRLIVWAKPGTSGRFDEPNNWLANGSVAKTLASTAVWSGPAWGRKKQTAELDKDTDILFPAAGKDYQVRGRSGAYLARHMTIESHAFFSHNLKGGYGNLWVAQTGRLDGGGCAFLRGSKHTFFLNGVRRKPGPVDWTTIEAKHFARKWILRKDSPEASMEFIGSIGSGDETHIVRGRGVVSENSSIMIGARCCQTVRREASLVLTSGAVLAKHSNQLHKQDMLVGGELLAGTPERPLTSDCYLGISFKDHKALFAGDMWKQVGKERGFFGFEVVAGGTIRVHSTNPSKARLVFACHQKEGAGDSGRVPGKQDPKRQAYDNLPRRINMVIWTDADVELNGVVFNDIEQGGIRLEDMSIKDSWKNVVYGDNNGGSPEELFMKHKPQIEGRGAYSFPIESVAKGKDVGGDTLFVRSAGTPIIETPAGCYASGKPIKVTLSTENTELEVRYTLDGKDPSAQSSLYEEPFSLNRDAVVKAASFRSGKQVGDVASATFSFVAADSVDLMPSTETNAASPGVSLRYYEGKWKRIPDFGALKPKRTATASSLNLDAIEPRSSGFGVVFDGYIRIAETGVYTIYANTGKSDAVRVSLGGKPIVDNDMKSLESHGTVGLTAGLHPLKIEFVDNGWGSQLRLSYRRIRESKAREVTKRMLTH
jgi:hypothetical protein